MTGRRGAGCLAIKSSRTAGSRLVAAASGQRLQATRVERRQVDVARCSVEDQLGHRLAGRRRVQHAPDAVTRRHEGAVHTRHPTDQRQAILGARSEARLARQDRRLGECRRDLSAHRLQSRVRTFVGNDVGGIDRQRRRARHRAHPGRAVDARKQLGRQDLAVRLLVLEEQGLRGNGLAGLEHEAVALVAVHRGQGQPARRQDRPRSQGDDHGVALDDLTALERGAAHGSCRASHKLHDRAMTKLRAVRLSGTHQAHGEGTWLDQRRRLRRAELTRDGHPS